MPDRQEPAGALHGLEHAVAVLDRGRERLLHQNVLAGLERGDGDARVQMVRRRDGDGVDIGCPHQRLPVGQDARARVVRGLAAAWFSAEVVQMAESAAPSAAARKRACHRPNRP